MFISMYLFAVVGPFLLDSVSSNRPRASTVPLVSSLGAVPHVLDRSRGRPPRDYTASINAILDVDLETKSHYINVVLGIAISSRFLNDFKLIVAFVAKES